MQLTLAPQEQVVLSWAVESAISDLRTEIGHTDNQAMGVISLHASVPNFRMTRRLL